VIGLTKALAGDLARFGNRVNEIAPGMIENTEISRYLSDPALREKIACAVRADRIGRPEEVAEVVAFPASARASYVSGRLRYSRRRED